MSWSVRLVKPIIPARGSPIVTLADARAYILQLPQSEQQSEIVQATADALLMAAEGRGPVLIAQAGVAQMVHGPVKIGEHTTAKKERPWRRTKIA